ncbi:ribosome production factor 2 [Hyaloraphidium curvatum]|nr:ribosome production factor 2 [Hyaloraphidium curvatum]
MIRVAKPKNARSKRALEKREPKLVENAKNALFVRGTTTNGVVNEALRDLCSLKKPHGLLFSKRNDVHPFDDVTPLHFLSEKNDASLVVVGTHSKKRPSNLVFARMFNHEVLDLIELGVLNWKPMSAFAAVKAAVGLKPLMVFSGDIFDQREDYAKLKNMLLDFFRGEEVDKISLSGLEYVISITAEAHEPPRLLGRVFFRVYTVTLKKSGVRLPRVELQEMGPAIDFAIRRTRFANPELAKQATRVPKELKPTKTKNISKDAIGDKFGRIHMKQQPLKELQLRKMKGLKRKPEEQDGDGGPVAKKRAGKGKKAV